MKSLTEGCLSQLGPYIPYGPPSSVVRRCSPMSQPCGRDKKLTLKNSTEIAGHWIRKKKHMSDGDINFLAVKELRCL